MGKSRVTALNPKQQRFVAEFLVDFNATKAAIRSGYSARTAGAIGGENLQKPEILAAIQSRRAAVVAKLEITVERLVTEMARIALADPRKLFDERGHLKPLHELDDETAAALSGFDIVTKSGTGG